MSKVPGMNRRAAAAIIRSIEGMRPAQDAAETARDDESRAVSAATPPSGTPTPVGVPDGPAESPAPAPSAPAAGDSALPSSGGTRAGAGAPDDGIHGGQAAGAIGARSLPADA